MTIKKSLSIFLMLLLVFTALPLTAFALNTTQDIADMLDAYAGKWNGFTSISVANKAEKEADSAAILAAYQALANDTAKDALGHGYLANLNALTYHYLRSVHGSATASAAYINAYIADHLATAKMLAAQRLARIIYGLDEYAYTKTDGNPGTMKFTATLDYADADIKKAYDAFLAELAAADALVKEYLCMVSSAAQFSRGAPYYHIPQRAVLVQIKYTMDNNPALTRDAAVIKVLKEYDVLGKAFTDGFRLAADGTAVLLAYDTSGDALDISGLAGLQARADALPKFVLNTLNSLNSTAAAGYPLGTVNRKLIAPSHVKDILLAGDAIHTLVQRVKAYDLAKPNNQVIRDIRAAYNSIASAPRSYIATAAFLARYDAIYATYQPMARPERDSSIPSKDDFIKAEVKYPFPACKPTLALSLCALDPLSALIAQLALGDIGTLLYTNSTIGTLAGLNGTLYDLLAQEAGDSWGILQQLLTAGGALPHPQVLAQHLTEPEFAQAKAKLMTLSNWSEFDPADYDWNVTAGDRESFVGAAIAVLRPITGLLYYFAGIPDTFDDYGDFTADGTYETTLIPFLEALGCRGIVPADDFMKQALALPPAASEASFGNRQDALALALVNPVLNLLEDLAASPLYTLLDILPRLAYAEQSGTLSPLFNWELDFFIQKAAFIPFDSLQGLVDMIAGTVPLTLPAINWDTLAHLGKLEHRASANGKYVYRNFVIADRADVFTSLARYLGKVLENSENLKTIGDMIFDAMGIRISTADLIRLRDACKSGDPAQAAKILLGILEDLIKKPSAPPCCEDKDTCGCICTNGSCNPACPCTCGGCSPEPGEPPTDDNKPFDFLAFLKSILESLNQSFSRIIEVIWGWITGKPLPK